MDREDTIEFPYQQAEQSDGKKRTRAHIPTEKERRQVKMLAAMGVPDYDIAKVIGLSQPTMRKYFWRELEIGHIEANAKVAESLFKQATGEKPNVTAAIFWLKCRAGWKEDASAPTKREQAAQAAETAPAGTSWESLLHAASATPQ